MSIAMNRPMPAHRQADYSLRADWGLSGARAISVGCDVAVVVDVLSFTTTLTVAADRRVTVFPFPWRDDRAAAFATERQADFGCWPVRGAARSGQSLAVQHPNSRVPETPGAPLAGRPYDLRHAAVSLWLNRGVPAPAVAQRAGPSVDVLLKVYTKCIEGDRAKVNNVVEDAFAE